MPSSYIATALDAHFIEEVRGVTIMPAHRLGAPLPPARPGTDVAEELAGRLLVRYLTTLQVGAFTNGSAGRTYVSPTPYSEEEAVGWLLLPAPLEPRTHLLLLKPEKIPWIIGPLWVAQGWSIQYILPDGFAADEIVVPGAPGANWELEVR